MWRSWLARPPWAEGPRLKSFMYYAYVIKNKSGLLYKGSTQDLAKRLAEHNTAGSGWTNQRCPWRLVYTERCATRSDALSRERFLKSGMGRAFLKKILNIK